MHNIYYQSSQGEIINLIEKPYKMLTETDMFDYEWQWETVGTNFPRITALKKQLVSPSFTIVVSGTSKQDMLDNVEHLTSVFDGDCYRGEMGRLYVGNYYRDCFITASTKSKIFQRNITSIEFVATSDNAEWKYEKEISFSGSGALVGEIADKMYVSASHREQNIIYTPQADHTAHLEWSANWYGDQWIRFDLGQITNIAEFSGISLSTVGSTPISCKAEISSGERITDYATNTHAVNVPVEDLDRIVIDDFTEVTIENINLDGARVYLYGYYDDINYSYREVFEGDTIDVSEFRFFKLYTAYAPNHFCTVAYAMNVEQWTTVETYSSEGTVELSDIECSSIRLRGSMIGVINDDISVISDEDAPVRNLFRLGYQLENLTYSGIPVDFTFRLQDATQYGYVYFDDENVLLKRISTNNVLGGGCEVQGLSNNEWVTITDITAQMSQTYNTHYDQIRLVKEPKTQSPLTYDYIRINIGVIGVITDAKVYNESYAPSNAIIEISGMPNNPSVMIGNNEYGATIELQANHKLIIDTKNKTVQDYNESTDDYENVFDKRTEDAFEKIEVGESEVTWGGNANIKITLEQARSDPKWN